MVITVLPKQAFGASKKVKLATKGFSWANGGIVTPKTPEGARLPDDV